MASMLGLAAFLLAASATPVVSPLPLAELPTQKLAVNECALVLWDRATGRRIAMMLLNPEAIRVVSKGSALALPRKAGEGEAVAGFVPRAEYTDGTLRIVTDLAIVANDTPGSAIVRDGVISVTDSDGVEVVAPVAGIAGCNR
ncbi:hypothetical protein [Polymorphobacter fuscus]|uniref:Uncharacterized protein n=1 Tax=Sandarakinorhabdus fusca TaxID=1439888 RepID=A0A7C9KVZ1_9SPHN|nr:hypothetical protein [Polymorphobacter fuscus]KAB7648988.1 hypothetical protein F9290_04835 [Polymorphobacter fuscus]MQT16585.1 hypothetical protein [Polymorphobacter fuscus]NJC07125.1 hypothetical protein [Polymorphobacter fuscus]